MEIFAPIAFLFILTSFFVCSLVPLFFRHFISSAPVISGGSGIGLLILRAMICGLGVCQYVHTQIFIVQNGTLLNYFSASEAAFERSQIRARLHDST